MRKALVVGIDHYTHIGGLNGCVNDAYAVKQMLDRHADGSVNFVQPKLIVGTGPTDIVERSELKESVRELFVDDNEVVLFYFAGHGYLETAGGYLCAGDCKTGDDGLPLSEIMTFANNSPARNKIIILDSCHSGVLGEHAINAHLSEISEGAPCANQAVRADRLEEIVWNEVRALLEDPSRVEDEYRRRLAATRDGIVMPEEIARLDRCNRPPCDVGSSGSSTVTPKE